MASIAAPTLSARSVSIPNSRDAAKRQQRSKALPAADGGMTHRVEQGVASVPAGDEKTLEEVVDFTADALGLGVELEPAAIYRFNRHRTE